MKYNRNKRLRFLLRELNHGTYWKLNTSADHQHSPDQLEFGLKVTEFKPIDFFMQMGYETPMIHRLIHFFRGYRCDLCDVTALVNIVVCTQSYNFKQDPQQIKNNSLIINGIISDANWKTFLTHADKTVYEYILTNSDFIKAFLSQATHQQAEKIFAKLSLAIKLGTENIKLSPQVFLSFLRYLKAIAIVDLYSTVNEMDYSHCCKRGTDQFDDKNTRDTLFELIELAKTDSNFKPFTAEDGIIRNAYDALWNQSLNLLWGINSHPILRSIYNNINEQHGNKWMVIGPVFCSDPILLESFLKQAEDDDKIQSKEALTRRLAFIGSAIGIFELTSGWYKAGFALGATVSVIAVLLAHVAGVSFTAATEGNSW